MNALRRDIGRRRWNHRSVIGRIHESPADPDEEQDNANLHDDDDAIDEGRFLGAANKQTREQQQDEHRRDVHHPVHTAVVGHVRMANATTDMECASRTSRARD